MPQLDILMIAMFSTKFIVTFLILLFIIEKLYVNSTLMLNISKNELAGKLQLFVPLNWNSLIEC